MPSRTPKQRFMVTTLSLFVAHSVSAASATPAQEKNSSEDTLIVSANRSETNLWNSPATIQVIDKETLEKSTNTSLADDLQDIPGVEVTDNALAGRKQIRIRGEESSRVLLMIDGQEVTYQRAGVGNGPGLLIDESALERIEVVKGPYSVLYGSQAIGGIVNFITKKGGNKPLAGNVKATYSSATAGWQESAAAWGSIENFDYRINGSYSDQNNRKTPDGRLPNTGFRNTSQGLWLGYTIDRHKFGLSLDRYRLATQTWYEDPSYEAFSVNIPELTREKIGLFYDFAVGGEYLKKLHLDGWSQTIDRTFENDVAVSTPTGSPMIGDLRVANQTHSKDKQYTQGLTFQSNFTLPANNNLVLGAQYQRDKIKQTTHGATESSSSTGFPSAVNYSQNSVGHNRSEQSHWSLFGQNEWQFAGDWSWTLGARQSWLTSQLNHDDTRKTDSRTGTQYTTHGSDTTHDNAFVTATSLRYSGFEDVELRVAFAQGYVFPTLTQLFTQTTAGGGITYGNPDLRSEHSNNYELGARYKGNMWYVDGALYYSDAKDYIATVSCSGQSACNGNNNSARTSYRYFDNVDRAKTYGMELTAEYNAWTISPYLSGNILRRQYDGRTLKTWDTGEPTINGRFGVRHTLTLNALNLTSDIFVRAAASATDKTSGEDIRYPGWATLNMAFKTEFGPDDQYQLNLALNNLTDKRYQTAHESIPAAGFNAAVGFGWKF